MIKKYRIGIMTYLFEVGSESYGKSCSAFSLIDMEQKQYIPVAGSIAVYAAGKATSLGYALLTFIFLRRIAHFQISMNLWRMRNWLLYDLELSSENLIFEYHK